MQAFFSGWTSEVQGKPVGTVTTVELQTASSLREVQKRNDSIQVFADMWRTVCHHRATATFIELQLPDLMGSDFLTVEAMSERARCENIPALKSLCDTLVDARLLHYDSNQQYSLTDAGALLQRGLDANVTHVMDAMFSAKVGAAWQSLGAVIVKKPEATGSVDDEVLTMHCDDFAADTLDELTAMADKFPIVPQQASQHIVYWGLEDALPCLQSLYPNANIKVVDASNEIADGVDVLILHRTMAVYGLPDVIQKCKQALSPSGSMIVVDVIEHPVTRACDLYAHAALLPPRPTEEEWFDMWGEDMQLSQIHHIRDGLMVMQISKPMRI